MIKVILLLFLAVVMFTACNTYSEPQTAIPPSTFPVVLQTTPSALPPTDTSTPIIERSPIPVSVSPTIVVMEHGITWTECVVPNKDYAHSSPDMTFASSCFQNERPTWNDNDRKMAGERIEGSNGSDLQQVIGNDVFLVKHDSTNGCCDYEFSKNGQVILQTRAPLITFDPNRNLWNIGGKAVWELVTDPPTIIVDDVNFNEKYQLEGAFIPYTIQDRLIYIAKKDGIYQIVYDNNMIGPKFDEIYIKYCCATTKVLYGEGRYWFWGKREGIYYVVEIR
jgi:hypothetical protein